MKTPDTEIAERIIDQFRARKLLSEARLIKLETNLSSGKITAEDWRLLFELDRSETKEETGNESR